MTVAESILRARLMGHFKRERPKIESEWLDAAVLAIQGLGQPPEQIMCPDGGTRYPREIVERLNLTEIALEQQTLA